MGFGKIKQSYTGATIVTEAEVMGRALKKSLSGHREMIRSTLQKVQAAFLAMRTSETLQKSLRRELQKRDENNNKESLNLELELMAIVTGNSRAGRQRASKYCTVLKILEEDQVKLGDVAKAIKDRGGIEKIVARKKASVAPARRKQDDGSESHQRRRGANDQETECVILIRLSDRECITNMRSGAAITLDVTKVDSPKADLKLRHMRDDDDW